MKYRVKEALVAHDETVELPADAIAVSIVPTYMPSPSKHPLELESYELAYKIFYLVEAPKEDDS